MAGIEKLKDKLSLYLSTLSDSAQSLLLRSLEKSQRDGTNDAASDLILLALREVLNADEPDIALENYAKSDFFRAAAVFTTEIDHARKVEARISPSSSNAIWTWILRDIATPAQVEQLQQPCNGLSEKEIGNQAKLFRDVTTPAINKYLNNILRDLGGEQKIGNQLGGELVYFDLREILASGEQLLTLVPLLSKLPAEISSWETPDGDEAYKLISRHIQQAPLRASWLFSALTKRLSNQKLKIQLATKLAGSDDSVQVIATVYAPAVDQVLADMEAHLEQFANSLKDASKLDGSIEHLSIWRRLAKSLEAELEIPTQCVWGKALASMKTKLSELLESEIEGAPGLVRKSLRAPKEGAREVADVNLLQDATRAVELFHHAERMKDSIALNGPITRIRKELDQSFEILTTSLIERSRQAVGNDVEACRLLGDAAAVFAKHLFDDKYASAFRRQLKAAASVQDLRVAEA